MFIFPTSPAGLIASLLQSYEPWVDLRVAHAANTPISITLFVMP
jgi:hypothetical protein